MNKGLFDITKENDKIKVVASKSTRTNNFITSVIINSEGGSGGVK